MFKTSICSVPTKGQKFSPWLNEVPSHIPGICSFRLQPKQFHVTCLTLSQVFLPLPTHLTPATTFLHSITQSSTPLQSSCPNHINLPHLTTSATLWTPRRLYIESTLSALSRLPYADFQLSLPMSQSHKLTHSGHMLCTSRPSYNTIHHRPSR